MSRRGYKDGKNKREAGQYLALPMAVLRSPCFHALSPKAVKLLLDMGSQYNGKNNGDLSAAWKIMSAKGWRSEATLNKAKKELLGKGFLFEMRKGRLPNLCSLYAITWFAIDPSDKYDIELKAYPYGAWKRGGPSSIRPRLVA